MERGTRWMRRALTLAVAAPLALAGTATAQDAGGARPRPRGPHGDLGARSTDVDGLPRRRRLPGAREGERPGQARQGRRSAGNGARSRRQLELGARPARHRAAPEVQEERLGLPLLEPEQDRRRQHHGRRRAADGQPHRPLRVGATASSSSTRTSSSSGPSSRTRPRTPSAATTTAASSASGRTASCTRSSATPAVAGKCRTSATGPFTPPADDDQFGGPGDRRPAPHGRDHPCSTRTATRRATTRSGVPAGRWAARSARTCRSSSAYGIRNSFGMAFDPRSGDLWQQENGDDSFSELNRVRPGMNSRLGPDHGPGRRASRQFKAIETTMGPISAAARSRTATSAFSRSRWLPTNIADTPAAGAVAPVRCCPGAFFSDPELSWKFEVGPGGIGFLDSDDLGRKYAGDLFVGGSRDFLDGGHLFRFNLTRNRRDFDVADPRPRRPASRTTSTSGSGPRASRCSSAATSGRARTSRPAPTATSTSSR